MGEFMQYLPGLRLGCVITSGARLRPRLRLSGHVPAPDPEIWVCTKPPGLMLSAAAKRCGRQGACGSQPGMPATRCWMRFPPMNTSKNRPCHVPHPPSAPPGCPCNVGAIWVKHGCGAQGLHQASQPPRRRCSNLCSWKHLPSNARLNQRDSAEGPACAPAHS